MRKYLLNYQQNKPSTRTKETYRMIEINFALMSARSVDEEKVLHISKRSGEEGNVIPHV